MHHELGQWLVRCPLADFCDVQPIQRHLLHDVVRRHEVCRTVETFPAAPGASLNVMTAKYTFHAGELR